MAVQRVQIPISFQYETTVYVATSSGGGVTTQATVMQPAVGSAISVLDRNTGSPITLFSSSTGSTSITSPVTDAGGNVPGWVVEGSYTITAASVGSFAGATVNWEAVRGDGVENIFAGAVGNAALASGAVTTSKLAAATSQALVPTGTVLDFAGSAVPAGYLLSNGAAVSRTTYATLFGVLGTVHGSGDGSTTFNLPDFRQRFALGVAGSGTGSALGSKGGTIDHTHSVPGLSVPALNIGNHTHVLSNSGGAMIDFFVSSGYPSFTVNPSGPINSYSGFWRLLSAGVPQWVAGTLLQSSVALTGATDSGGGGKTGTGTTGTGVTGITNPPFLAIQKIIKT